MIGTPNIIAYLALVLWLPICMAVFYAVKPPVVAATWLMLGCIMFLPEWVNFDPPLVPAMDKQTLGCLGVFIGCLLFAPERIRAAKPMRGIDFCFVMVCVGSFFTNVNNPEPIVYGTRVLSGLTLYDTVSIVLRDVFSIYMPFLIGRAMLRGSSDLRRFFSILVHAGLIYSLILLVELRLSPQVHRWVYGYHQMDFTMTMRWGGYRPMAFMLTGLAVGMFVLTVAMAAASMSNIGEAKRLWPFAKGSARATWGKRVPWYLSILLVLCKSTGAIMYGALAIPLVWRMKKPRVLLALVLAATVILFPVLRARGWFPTEFLVAQAEALTNEDRALSLWFRFWNEDQLLERAAEHTWFGWGGYGRNRIYDHVSGEDLSVTDGDWIIQVGSRGLFGFGFLYALLVLPIFLAARKIKKLPDPKDRRLAATLCLIVALNATDLLPNGLFHFLPYFFSGALMGLVQGKKFEAPETRERETQRRERRASRSAELDALV